MAPKSDEQGRFVESQEGIDCRLCDSAAEHLVNLYLELNYAGEILAGGRASGQDIADREEGFKHHMSNMNTFLDRDGPIVLKDLLPRHGGYLSPDGTISSKGREKYVVTKCIGVLHSSELNRDYKEPGYHHLVWVDIEGRPLIAGAIDFHQITDRDIIGVGT